MTTPHTPVMLFDFGGVLVDLDKPRCVSAFSRLGFDVTPYLGAFKQGGPFSLLERGAISVPEFCAEIRRLGGLTDVPDAAITQAWESFLTGVPAARLDMLLRIRRHYPVSLLSNTNVLHWAQARDDFFRRDGHCVADFFDHVFLSCELGVEKPDAPIFEAVVRKLGVPAEQIVFFDDSEVNCEGARRCGLQARLAGAGSQWFSLFTPDGRLIDAG